jgi:hypothetical protein
MAPSDHVVTLHCVINLFEAVVSQPTFENLVIVLYYVVTDIRTIESGMCFDTICEGIVVQKGVLCYWNRHVKMILALNLIVFVNFRIDEEDKQSWFHGSYHQELVFRWGGEVTKFVKNRSDSEIVRQ